MRASSLLLFLALSSFARTPSERLDPRHLEAVHAQRVEWMKQRIVAAQPGIYQDFRSVHVSPAVDSLTLVRAARDAEVRVVFTKTASLSGIHEGVLFLGRAEGKKELPQFPDEPGADPPKTPKEQRAWEIKFKHYPDEVFAVAPVVLAGKTQDRQSAAFRNASVHILARELTETEVRLSRGWPRVHRP